MARGFKLGLLGVLVVAAWLVSGGSCPRSEPPPAGLEPAPRVGAVAPDFSLPDLLSGEPISLSHLRGCVVLLEFGASWCAPCRESAPWLLALASHFQERGLVLVGVSLDRTLEAARALWNHPADLEFFPLWGSFEQAMQVARLYAVPAIPRVFLIDRQGVIRFVGHPSELTPELIEPWL
ncbi:MAG TPA: TlpA family protein disulfide reductase [Candidatus Acetothermia bacterium]|nr:TlpA family protein disulfide reductase [Candidatus Acetothermia bacterium]